MPFLEQLQIFPMQTARYRPVGALAPWVDRKSQEKFELLPRRIYAATTLTGKHRHSG
jgi:hypothetical protein